MADYDVIIIGSGLAGLTAGLFAARHGLSTLILESNIPGGHLISIDKIEDFPGFPDGIAGYDLCPTVQRQEALTLANFAEQVLLFHNSEKFSAQNSYRQRVMETSKIIPRYQSTIEEILGDDVVTGVRVRDLHSREVVHVELAGLFIYVGLQPSTEFLRSVIKLNDTGHVPTDGSMKTVRDGLYAVGDIRQDSASQAITSAGDGATAAMAAYHYIRNQFGEKGTPV